MLAGVSRTAVAILLLGCFHLCCHGAYDLVCCSAFRPLQPNADVLDKKLRLKEKELRLKEKELYHLKEMQQLRHDHLKEMQQLRLDHLKEMQRLRLEDAANARQEQNDQSLALAELQFDHEARMARAAHDHEASMAAAAANTATMATLQMQMMCLMDICIKNNRASVDINTKIPRTDVCKPTDQE